ncbi:MAG: hypothetical protein ACKO85_02115 [Isosphaeraceae bacterium]
MRLPADGSQMGVSLKQLVLAQGRFILVSRKKGGQALSLRFREPDPFFKFFRNSSYCSTNVN